MGDSEESSVEGLKSFRLTDAKPIRWPTQRRHVVPDDSVSDSVVVMVESSSDTDTIELFSPRTKRYILPTDSEDSSPPPTTSTQHSAHRLRSLRTRRDRKRLRPDPDEDDNDGDDECTDKDEVDDLRLDEPERFQRTTRLRPRLTESPHRRLLRQLEDKVHLNRTYSGNEDEPDDSRSPLCEPHSSDEDFIVEDDNINDDSFNGLEDMPREFTHAARQSLEFKFEVLFHYLVILEVLGPSGHAVDQDTSDYLQARHELGEHLRAIKESRISSSRWSPEFMKVLETYPSFVTLSFNGDASVCDLCHRKRTQCAKFFLKGIPYDRETHQRRPQRSMTSQPGSKLSDIVRQCGGKAEFVAGNYCLDLAYLYHKASHWEHEVFLKIRHHYHDLLRATAAPIAEDSDDSPSESGVINLPAAAARTQLLKRRQDTAIRVQKLRQDKNFPNREDPSAVTDWMEQMGYMEQAFQMFKGIRPLAHARRFPLDPEKDE